MAITKLVSANTPNPLTAGAGGDWDLAMAQLTACKQLLTAKPMILTNWSTYTKPALAEGSYIQHLGSIYIVDTEDYELPDFSSDYSNYIKVTESGDTLDITIINSTSGYIWTPVYNGLYNGVHQLLPYRIDYILPSKNYYKYRFIDIDCKVYMDKNGNISTAGAISATGAISGATLNTGQGANELYAMNQNVRTTDSPTFADLVVPDNFLVAGNTNYYGIASFNADSTGEGFASTITVPCSGSFRCVSTIASTYFSGSTYAYMSMVVYKNGSEVYRYDSTTQETVTKSYDVTFSTGNTIKLHVYLRAQAGSGSASATNTYFRTNKSKLVSSLYHNMFVFTDES